MNFKSGYYNFYHFGVHDFVFMQFHKKNPAELRTGIKK